MDENNTNQGLSTFFGAFKIAIPGISDEDLASLYKEISSNKDDPDKISSAINGMKTKYTKPVDKVNVTGQRMPLNYNLKSPYEGTSQEAANPDNPAASAISQFDPRALQAAQAEYKKQYDNTMPYRSISNMLAGAVSGFDGQAPTRNAAGWEAQDKNRYLQTIGAQEALQKQSTEGLNAATTLQNMSKQAGEYEGTQKGKELELQAKRMSNEGAGLDLQARKDLADPNSPQTMLAKQLLIDQLKTSGNISPELMKMLQGPVSAQQLMAFMDPQVLKAFQTKVGIQSTQQDVIKKQQENQIGGKVTEALTGQPAPGGSNRGPDTKVSPGDQAGRDRERLRIVKEEYEKEKDPATKAALFREMNSIAASLGGAGSNEIAKRLPYSPISAAGQTLQPDPRVMAGAAAEGNAAADAEKRIRTYETELAPTIKSLRAQLEKASTGPGTEVLARIFPGENRELVNLINRFNAQYPGTLASVVGAEMAKSIDKGQLTGSVVSNLTKDQTKRILDLIESSAGADRQYQQRINQGVDAGATPGRTGANTPMPDTKPAAPPAPAAKTVRMIKNGSIYEIPTDRVEDAKKKGYTLQ